MNDLKGRKKKGGEETYLAISLSCNFPSLFKSNNCSCKKLNKRAMMALDRSPESFSQMNSTSLFPLFQLVAAWVGHHMNKIHKGLKGPQRDAKYQVSKL